jgi:hypothetical protein
LISPATSPSVAAGVRTGIQIIVLGALNIAISTLTPISNSNWKLLQNAFSILLIFACGFAGVKAYAAARSMTQCALAGLVAGAVGTAGFNLVLILAFALLRGLLVQFPFANSQSQLVQAAVGSLIILPMTAGFGYLGGMVAQSVDSFQKDQ